MKWKKGHAKRRARALNKQDVEGLEAGRPPRRGREGGRKALCKVGQAGTREGERQEWLEQKEGLQESLREADQLVARSSQRMSF